MSKLNTRRSACAIANGLDILGDRWTLLIIRDLMLTNRREFGHLLQSGEGISTNILAERLERLLSHGIISKAPHADHGKKFIYQLTDAGLNLAPVIVELTLWAHEHIEHTFVPAEALAMMKSDKEKLLSLIKQKSCLISLEL